MEEVVGEEEEDVVVGEQEQEQEQGIEEEDHDEDDDDDDDHRKRKDYKSFIDKLRRRLGMQEFVPTRSLRHHHQYQYNDNESEEEEEEEEVAAVLEEEEEKVAVREEYVEEATEQTQEEEEELTASEETTTALEAVVEVGHRHLDIEPLIEEVVLEHLFSDAASLAKEEPAELSPNTLLGVTKYDSDKVVLMLKERILDIQKTMQEEGRDET